AGRRGGERRVDAPPGDELEDEQEEHRGERGGDEPECGSRAGGQRAARGRRYRVRDRGWAERDDGRGERDRRLRDEDRPPAERLGQRAAERGAGGGAEDR